MSRIWPTAEMAWSVARSVGRLPDRPSAGSPAAMAPELTTITRCPWPRSPATLVQSLSMAWMSISPWRSVTDDVPIFTTTITGAPRSTVGLVLEAEPGDAHEVALPRPRAGQGPVHSQAAQAVLYVVEGLGVGEVAHGHGSLRRTAPDHEGAVVTPLHEQALRLGPVHDDPHRR